MLQEAITKAKELNVDIDDIVADYGVGHFDEEMAINRIAVRCLLSCPCQ